ncbi:vWA domain-containing protein, partial [Corynebacterium sp.]|uniref:vWA domain-containing protein n=1 Tax=Corynebacterium sp. TaxID=1720 RepID=UPI002A90EC91
LLDTSSAAGATFFGETTAALSATALDLGADGHQVSVWNYSSPLNPGVARGYRRNIDMTGDASEVAQSVRLLGTGGQAQTREAVNAAVQYAAQRPEPTRIVVVTTGTADAGDDAAFTADIDSVLNDSVEISVVHVGPGMEDPALAQLAQYHPLAVESADIGPALATATRVLQ